MRQDYTSVLREGSEGLALEVREQFASSRPIRGRMGVPRRSESSVDWNAPLFGCANGSP
jgi:hypothetical protein